MKLTWSLARINYSLLALAIVAYLGLTFFAPLTPTAANLQLSALQLVFLKLTVAIPYILTWTMAIYGLTILGQYLKTANNTENKLMPLLAALRKGLTWIIIGLIATVLVGALKSYSIFMPSALPAITIVTNYLYIFPLLMGIWELHKGTKKLRLLQQDAKLLLSDRIVRALIIVLLAAFYVFLVFTNPNRQVGPDAQTAASYYLPDPLIVLTIIVPIFSTWWLGFSVAFGLSDNIPRIASAAYFKAMTKILYGIWAIIFTSILLQTLLSLGTTRLLAIGLGMLLLLIYVFLLLQGLSYLFLALGIKKLKNIKELMRTV